MPSRAGVLVAIAAVLVLVCFFLPWLGAEGANVSGWQMAADLEGIGWGPLFRTLFLIPLAAIGCLVVVTLVYVGKMAVQAGAWLTLALAGVGLGVLLAKLEFFVFFTGSGESTFEFLQIGAWGMLAAHIALIVGAALGRGRRDAEDTVQEPAA